MGQFSICAPEEAQAVMEEVLSKEVEKVDSSTSNSSLSKYHKEMNRIGLRKLQSADTVVVLKVYFVQLKKQIDSLGFYARFHDYFEYGESVYIYMFYRKNAVGEYYDAGNYSVGPGSTYEYDFNNNGLHRDVFIDNILTKDDYKDAAILLFPLGKTQLGFCLVHHGTLYKPETKYFSSHLFESEEEEIDWFNKYYKRRSTK